jgi:hypothetical protein
VTGLDYAAKIALVEHQNEMLLRHAYLQHQLRSSKSDYQGAHRICCLMLYRIGELFVSWGTGLQKRYGSLADASA